jgi:hypothetical protein
MRGALSSSSPLLATGLSIANAKGVWYFLEVKFKIDSTSGVLEVRVNEIPVISLVNVNTGSGQWDTLELGDSGSVFSSGAAVSWDDFYLIDNLGTINNTYLGTSRVQTLFNTGPGDFTDWVPTPALTPNWQAASNLNTNNTSYVSASTPGDRDLYNVQNLVNAPTIFAVQARFSVRQDDASQREIAGVIKSGTTVDVQGGLFPDSGYRYLQTVWELNPDTGLSFSPSEVNSLQVGPEIIV